MILGTYHFYLTNDDPIKQADHFKTTISTQGSPDITPIVDIEQGSLPQKGKVDKAKLESDLFKFLDAIEAHYKRVPIIYTGEAFANQYLTNEKFSKYPLWLAEYSGTPSPKIPFTWQKTGYKIWQKSDKYLIDSKPTDFDIFHGLKSDLYK